MPAYDTIKHPGKVIAIEESQLQVLILSQSACSACHAKGVCGMSEMQEKIVEVVNPQTETYQINEDVNVVMKQSYGNKAVFYGYFLPLLLIVATLIIMISITGNEGRSGLVAISILLPYYLLLYLFREKLKSGFRFHIEKIH